MWHAWHFQFALGSVIKSPCGSFCIACLHPLTRRYVHEAENHFCIFDKPSIKMA
ncbi:DUF3265 domain-containing protein [Vibrio parahaemolyticus]|nr:DUF3265 domain-containing protein [Vibrio parahaemolyticus]EJC7971304.1 DUF3265 domain-containing protein [Vibrio parahaemolyticus]